MVVQPLAGIFVKQKEKILSRVYSLILAYPSAILTSNSNLNQNKA
jgi:hypothetical protein